MLHCWDTGREDDCLNQSNFAYVQAELEAHGIEVTVARFSHWAVGWIDHMLCDDTPLARQVLTALYDSYDSYPCFDEDDYSDRQQEAAESIWRDCYNDRERLEYIRQHPDYFSVHSMGDLMAQVRGRYFGGYASELIA
jgi:hypothetical protein